MSLPRAISLDLDDTLWAIGPVIVRAETELREWLHSEHPRTEALATAEGLAGIRADVVAREPERYFDFTWQRREILRELARRCDCPEDELVEHGFNRFWQARNRVQLFDDVVPALEVLTEEFTLVALTNGNADLAQVGLDAHFHHYVNAIAVGAPKPEPAIFVAAAEAAGCSTEEMLHVGDDPVMDVDGARKAGMRCAWMDRFGREWPDGVERAELQVTDLHELLALL